MNSKVKKEKNQVNIKNSMTKILSHEELKKKTDEILNDLHASTWHDLETKGKFTKNDKITFIHDDMLIVGCDIGSETHYVRAIDARGKELSKNAFSFSNSREGFESAKSWAMEVAARNDKKQIVLGLEPTGHYWFCLAKEYDEVLIESIQQHGLICPLLARKTPYGYEVFIGIRRLKVALSLRIEFVPIIVRNINDNEIELIRLENMITQQGVESLKQSEISSMVHQYHQRRVV